MTVEYQESGDRISLNPGQAYTAGEVYIIGEIPAVALDTYASTDTNAVFATRGVYNLDFDGADTAVQGEPAYWDAGNTRVTTEDTFPLIGYFWEASTGTEVEVVLGLNQANRDSDRAFIAIDDGDSPYTLSQMNGDVVITADTENGAITLNLPAAANATGHSLTVIREGTGTNAVTIDGDGSETINGSTTYAALDAQYDAATLTSNGTEWYITAANVA